MKNEIAVVTQNDYVSRTIDLSDATPLQPGTICLDMVRAYRADCQSGQFKIGAAQLSGPKLEFEFVHFETAEGEFYGYTSQRWLRTLFIDSSGMSASCLFKGESMDSLLNLVLNERMNGRVILGKKLIGRMAKRMSKTHSTSYYAVEWEIAGEGKFSEAIAELKASDINLSALLPALR